MDEQLRYASTKLPPPSQRTVMERQRLHIGAAASQLASASESCCSGLRALRVKLTGRNDGGEPQPIQGQPNAEMAISDQLNFALEALGIAHAMLEDLLKEVSRG